MRLTWPRRRQPIRWPTRPWRNSEFSFFRLQYSHDDPTRTTTDNTLFLQYDVSLGAHGAHKF
jgi:hypothetical protein